MEITTLKVSSPVFRDGDPIPTKYTCDGLNINPSLHIEDVPKDARSLALIVEDPDAPAGTWDHWIVWNIPASVSSFSQESSLPAEVQGRISHFPDPGQLTRQVMAHAALQHRTIEDQ